MSERKVDVAIIGSGSAGLYALGRVRSAGKSWVLINGGEAGTTCARVGCMPSKAAIQVAEDIHRPKAVYKRYGIENCKALPLDYEEIMEYIQDIRDDFVDRVLSSSTDDMSETEFIEGYAQFVEPNLLKIDNGQYIRADKMIIATGSTPIVPDAWKDFGERILTTDQFFEQTSLPESIAVIGLGVIGLELGQMLARLDIKVTGIEGTEHIGGITDPEVNQSAIAALSREFPIWLGENANISEAGAGKLKIMAGDKAVIVDKVLVSIGRKPNLNHLNLDCLNLASDQNGVPLYNENTMQIGDSNLFIAGDVNGTRALLHEAGDEGRIAGYNACADKIVAFKRKTPLMITFSDPNIIRVGQSYAELDLAQTAIGQINLAPVGRAHIMANNRGLMRVYADKKTGVLLGSEMFSVRGEHIAHLLCWCIAQKMTVGEVLRMPFYHPVIEEALQAALNDLYSKVEKKNQGALMEVEEL